MKTIFATTGRHSAHNKDTRCGTRTRNPQIRSLIRYPLRQPRIKERMKSSKSYKSLHFLINTPNYIRFAFQRSLFSRFVSKRSVYLIVQFSTMYIRSYFTFLHHNTQHHRTTLGNHEKQFSPQLGDIQHTTKIRDAGLEPATPRFEV